jgi:hypothetical protein
LDDGSFGMVAETGWHQQRPRIGAGNTSLGRAVGQMLLASGFPFTEKSILAPEPVGAAGYGPWAIGTDIIHMHPGFDAAGPRSLHVDFRIPAAQVARLRAALPQRRLCRDLRVFLKAVSLVRNLGHRLDAFTTVDLDFVRHYRPTVNVVQRPTARGGRGISLVGHHEIMLPLIAAGVIEGLTGC